MKKLIFLLLLAQTISFLYGDAGCLGSSPAHSYHGYNENKDDEWGMRISSPKHTNCDCNCTQHKRAGNKCINCGHINIPKALTISTKTPTTKTAHKKSKPKKAKVSKRAQKKQAKLKKAQTQQKTA
jgi:hypothetical protein